MSVIYNSLISDVCIFKNFCWFFPEIFVSICKLRFSFWGFRFTGPLLRLCTPMPRQNTSVAVCSSVNVTKTRTKFCTKHCTKPVVATACVTSSWCRYAFYDLVRTQEQGRTLSELLSSSSIVKMSLVAQSFEQIEQLAGLVHQILLRITGLTRLDLFVHVKS